MVDRKVINFGESVREEVLWKAKHRCPASLNDAKPPFPNCRITINTLYRSTIFFPFLYIEFPIERTSENSSVLQRMATMPHLCPRLTWHEVSCFELEKTSELNTYSRIRKMLLLLVLNNSTLRNLARRETRNFRFC